MFIATVKPFSSLLLTLAALMVIYLTLITHVVYGRLGEKEDIDIPASGNTSALLPAWIWTKHTIHSAQENKRMRRLQWRTVHCVSLKRHEQRKVAPGSFYPHARRFFVICRQSRSRGWWVLNEIDFLITDSHSLHLSLQSLGWKRSMLIAPGFREGCLYLSSLSHAYKVCPFVQRPKLAKRLKVQLCRI